MEVLDPKSLLFSFILKESIRSRKNLADRFKEDGINLKIDQYVFLELIYTNKNTTQQEISNDLQKDKTIVLRQVKNMIEDGYVVRKVDEKDARKRNLTLTAKGEEIYAKAKASSEAFSQEILADMTEAQIEVLRQLFATITQYSKAD
ncbi:MAG: MarR family winged helix-turn-helix transcriptional regulator [Mangrovibacterium sp.]